jgi:hypothetical protein
MTVYIDDAKLLVEVKNYRGSVPGSEVEKFLRDLASGLSYGGVFISLNGPVSGAAEGLRFEQINGDFLPVMYVYSDDERIIVNAVQTVYTMITMQKWVLREAYSRDALARDINELTQHLDSLTRNTSAFYDSIDDINKLLRKSAQQLTLSENNLRNVVKTVREHLMEPRLVECGSVVNELEKNGQPVDEATRKIIAAVDLCAEVSPTPQWRVLKTKITHLPTGIMVSFTRNGNTVTLPDKYFDAHMLAEAYLRYGKQMTLDSGVNIKVLSGTENAIVETFVKRLQCR